MFCVYTLLFLTIHVIKNNVLLLFIFTILFLINNAYCHLSFYFLSSPSLFNPPGRQRFIFLKI